LDDAAAGDLVLKTGQPGGQAYHAQVITTEATIEVHRGNFPSRDLSIVTIMTHIPSNPELQ
jgi:hypothetical protein